MFDLQQLHTNMVDRPQISHKVLATVISYYSGRGIDGQDEAMCDAGAIAMSRDTGRIPGFGEVIGKAWKLGRISQEHGTLVQIPSNPASGHTDTALKVGEIIGIIGQHACLIAAAHQWFYIVDSDIEEGSDKVVDIWVPWKGW
jgi:D-serine deaminase-like pyridoxal phosphate-dependent protein